LGGGLSGVAAAGGRIQGAAKLILEMQKCYLHLKMLNFQNKINNFFFYYYSSFLLGVAIVITHTQVPEKPSCAIGQLNALADWV
jgi:hypothetical protein